MRSTARSAITAAVFVSTAFVTGCLDAPDMRNDPKHPYTTHELIPQYGPTNGQIANGVTTGAEGALDQPIAFPHYTHATVLEMECEYCHSEARKSQHAGVPATQTCMNCHKYVKTDKPEIKKLTAFFEKGEPIPWNKVHDLPDYVNFEHKRHVKAGVQCTECHGQVAIMGRPEEVTEKVVAEGEHGAEGHAEMVTSTKVKTVMVRETSLQMGWCLDCHATHPSVDEHYGDKAGIRRSELKDCYTCHK